MTVRVLGDMIVDQVRPVVLEGARALAAGEGGDPAVIGRLLAGRSYQELRAIILLSWDCAHMAKVHEVCGTPGACSQCDAWLPENPEAVQVIDGAPVCPVCYWRQYSRRKRQLKASGISQTVYAEDGGKRAHKYGEYAHLRAGGVTPEFAGPRAGLNDEGAIDRAEAAYQARLRGRAA